MSFDCLKNNELEEEKNIIMNIKKSENRKIMSNSTNKMSKALKDFNECVECQNYNDYEREQEMLRIIFNYKNLTNN